MDNGWTPIIVAKRGNLFMVVVGKHSTFLFFCGLVGNPHLTAKISFLLPFQRQPSLGFQTPSEVLLEHVAASNALLQGGPAPLGG